MEPAARWRPVGTVLVDNGSITQEQLEAALAEQRRSGRKLGEILINSGAITWLTLAHAIAEQAQDLDPSSEPTRSAPMNQEPAETRPATVVNGSGSAEERLRAVEALLKERQRAFLDLVSVTETLRSAVARLQGELATRDGEIARLRAEAPLR